MGGNYGEATPTDLTYVVSTEYLDGKTNSCQADKDTFVGKYNNTITALSAVEMTRRIALHREIPLDLQFPGATWKDMQNILYGAESSDFFPGLEFGGMSADTAVFLQSSTQMSSLLNTANHQDKWRIFSKLGAGWSTSRSVGEIVSNIYACVPIYDASGVNVIDGYEFTLSVRGSVPQDSVLDQVEKTVLNAVNRAMDFVVETHGEGEKESYY